MFLKLGPGQAPELNLHHKTFSRVKIVKNRNTEHSSGAWQLFQTNLIYLTTGRISWLFNHPSPISALPVSSQIQTFYFWIIENVFVRIVILLRLTFQLRFLIAVNWGDSVDGLQQWTLSRMKINYVFHFVVITNKYIGSVGVTLRREEAKWDWSYHVIVGQYRRPLTPLLIAACIVM